MYGGEDTAPVVAIFGLVKQLAVMHSNCKTLFKKKIILTKLIYFSHEGFLCCCSRLKFELEEFLLWSVCVRRLHTCQGHKVARHTRGLRF